MSIHTEALLQVATQSVKTTRLPDNACRHSAIFCRTIIDEGWLINCQQLRVYTLYYSERNHMPQRKSLSSGVHYQLFSAIEVTVNLVLYTSEQKRERMGRTKAGDLFPSHQVFFVIISLDEQFGRCTFPTHTPIAFTHSGSVLYQCIGLLAVSIYNLISKYSICMCVSEVHTTEFVYKSAFISEHHSYLSIKQRERCRKKQYAIYTTRIGLFIR